MKNIPNIISISRIFLSILFFFIKPLTPLFFIIYSICGFSDIIDGYIARKTNSTSNFGAKLDSLTDIIFISAIIIVFLPIILIPTRIIILMILIAIIRIISLLVIYFKYHTFAILHTYTNKIAGLSLFFFPYLYTFWDINILGYILCTIASIAAIEELVINIISKKLHINIQSIIHKY